MALFDPKKVLTRILDSLQQIDQCRYFALPVTDAEAPGYHTIIERPMCFATMREKVENHRYKTWGEFLSDFNLMVRNAMHYNDKKSHVYETARLLDKEGNQRLQEVDLEGRRAIFLSHANGPETAALDEAQEFRTYGLPIPMNPFLMIPTTIPTIDELDSTIYNEEKEDLEDCYSSFSETDGEEESRGQGCPSLPLMTSTLSASPMKGVMYQAWDKFEQWDSKRSVKSEFESADQEWTRMKSDLEWRSKWLYFRIKELKTRLEHYSNEDSLDDDDYLKYRFERTPVPEIRTEEALLEHPFFSRHCKGETSERLDHISEGEDSCEDDSYPARVFLNLGLLAEETPKLIALLSTRSRTSQTRMMPSDGRAFKAEKAPRRPQVSQGMLETKRTRRDDLDAHQSISFSTGVGGSMERPTRPNITTPHVKELTQSQLENWQSAKEIIKDRIEQGLSLQLPDEIKRKIFDDMIESSSEEDINDAIYLEKHKEMEVAEKERHLCVFGPSNGKHVHSSKKGIKDQSGPTSHHLLRQSSRRGRGRMKGSRPVGRPPLGNRRQINPHHDSTFMMTPTMPDIEQDTNPTSAPMSGSGL